MNSQYKASLKSQFIKMLEDLNYEEIAEKFVNNELAFKQFRNKCIKKDFKELDGTKGRMDVFTDLEEKYDIQSCRIRRIIKE
jgi:hypothetical protein